MDCVFCKIISGEIPARILKETEHSISFLDAFPLARGHTLVIPRNHHLKIQELSMDESADLFELVRLMIPRIDSLTGATLVAIHDGPGAGQEVPHVHVHLVPRSTDDSAGTVHTMFGSTLKLSESETDEIFKRLRD